MDDLLFLDLGVSVTTLSLGYERRVFAIGTCFVSGGLGSMRGAVFAVVLDLGAVVFGSRYPAGRLALAFGLDLRVGAIRGLGRVLGRVLR